MHLVVLCFLIVISMFFGFIIVVYYLDVVFGISYFKPFYGGVFYGYNFIGRYVTSELFIVFCYFWIFISFLLLFTQNYLSSTRGSNFELEKGKIATFALVFTWLILFFGYRFASHAYPMGWDTPVYIRYSKFLRQDFSFIFSIGKERWFVFLLIYLLQFLVRDINLLFALLPFVFWAVYAFGVFLLVFRISRNSVLSLLSTIFASSTFFTSRLYLDLVCNFIAWSFAILSFYVLSCISDEKSFRARYVLIFSTLSFFVMFSHIWTFFVITLISSIYIVVLSFNRREFKTPALLTFVFVYLPIVVVTVAIQGWKYVPWRWFMLFSESSRWQFVNRENWLILFFSIVGVFFIYFRARKNFARDGLLVIWYVVSSFLSIVGLYPHFYRFLFFIPTGIFAGYGAYYSVEYVYLLFAKSFSGDVLRRLYRYCLLFVFVIPVLLTSLPSAYIADHVARPSQVAMSQMEWVAANYGFNSSDVLVLVDRVVRPASGVGESDYYAWAASEIGKSYYSGTIFDLLQGFPRSRFASFLVERYYYGFDYPPSDLLRRDVLFLDKWYRMSSLEYAISEEVVDGIYRVLVKDVATLEAFLKNSSSFFLGDVSGLFRVVAGWGNFVWEVDNGSGCFGFWVSPVCRGAWFGVEVDLTREVGFRWGLTYVFLKVFGENVSGVFRVFIQVFDDYGEIAEREITDLLNGGYIIVPVVVPPDKAVWRVRLSLQSVATINKEFNFRIEYVALI